MVKARARLRRGRVGRAYIEVVIGDRTLTFTVEEAAVIAALILDVLRMAASSEGDVELEV